MFGSFLPSLRSSSNQQSTRGKEPTLLCNQMELAQKHLSGFGGGLNGSTQHLLEVYSQGSENLRFFSGVDLSAAPLCPDPTECSRTGLFSSGSIVVIAH